jgi:hypothetical protein
MKKFLRAALVVAGCLLALALGLWFFREPILRAIVEHRIRSQTGLTACIGRIELEFGSGRLTARDFRLLNRPEFGGQALLDLPELHVELDPESARTGKLRFRELRVHLAEVNVVRNAEGHLNLEALAAQIAPSALPAGFEFGGIDRLVLTLGRVTYTDLAQPANNHEVRLGVDQEVVENLRSEDEVNRWLASFVVRRVLETWLTQRGEARVGLLELLRHSFPKR